MPLQNKKTKKKPIHAIQRMQKKGLSMEEIMDMGYTMDEYKQALQTENQLIEK